MIESDDVNVSVTQVSQGLSAKQVSDDKTGFESHILGKMSIIRNILSHIA